MSTIYQQEPQAATMFMSLKKKPEKMKEKADFKLQFHAARVPQKGWDKLVVSLISVETGRSTVKTSRASVRNGNCQWPDLITESTKILFDSKTRVPADKLYRLVISSGVSRSGVLGEATINFADYVTATSPVAVALPLKNCSYGTTLHIKLHCLGPRTVSREVEKQRSLEITQEVSGSEENLEFSDFSGDLNEHARDILGKPTLEILGLVKDNGTPVSPMRCGSDSSDISSTPTSSGFSGSSRISQSGDMSSPWSSASSLSGGHTKRDQTNLPGVGAEEEKDSLKTALEELKSVNQASCKTERIDGSTRLGTEDKITDEKERNINLRLELPKNQGYNKEFVAVMQGLEERLEERGKEIEKLLLRSAKLESLIENAKCQREVAVNAVEKEWSARLLSKEEEIKALEARLLRQESNEEIMEESQPLSETKQGLYMTEMAELEQDLKELTEENLDLIFNLKETKKELENKNVVVKQLEEELKRLLDRPHTADSSENGLFSAKLAPEVIIDDVTAHEKDLSEENHDLQLNSLLIRATEAEDRHNAALQVIAGLEVESGTLKKENLDLLHAKIAAETLVSNLQGEKEELSRQLQEAGTNTTIAVSKVHEREMEIAQMLHDMATHSAEVRTMHSKISQLEKMNINLESRLQKSQEADRLSKSSASDQEHQLSALMAEMNVATLSKADLESRLTQCEIEKTAMEEALEKSLIDKRCAGHQVNGLVVKLSDLTAQLDSHIKARADLEKMVLDLESTKTNLESLVAILKKENVQLKERIAGSKVQCKNDKMEYEPIQALAGIHDLNHQESIWVVQKTASAEKTRLYLETQEKQLKDEGAGQKSTERATDKHLKPLKQSIVQSERFSESIQEGDEASMISLASLEAELVHSMDTYDDKKNSCRKELVEISSNVYKLEHRACNAEASLKEVQWQKEDVIESLQCEVKRLTEELVKIHGKTLTSQSLLANSEVPLERIDWDKKRHSKAAHIELQCESTAHELVLKSKSLKDIELGTASKVQELIKQLEGFRETHLDSKATFGSFKKQFLTGKNENEMLIKVNSHIFNPSKDFGLICAAAAELLKALANSRLQQGELDLSLHDFKLRFEGITKQKFLLEKKVMLLESSLADMEEVKSSKQVLEKRLRHLQDELDTLETIRLIEAEQRTEILLLREQLNEFKQEISKKEEKMEILRKQVEFLETELHQKVDAVCDIQKKLKEKEEHGTGRSFPVRGSPSIVAREGITLGEDAEFIQEDKQLNKTLSTFVMPYKDENPLERNGQLQKESAKFFKANTINEVQLQSAFAQEQNAHAAVLHTTGGIEQVVRDLVDSKRHSMALAEDLKDMQGRYLSMSLKYAEVEAEKEELTFSLRSLRNGKRDKPFAFRSWSAPSAWR
ncbi:hypothetical protein O6H91_22G055300 [Diphasiastrum complanatum]|uniref:Uncharacterized protein n=2 Tax=Diphasiastrum complanatum TaxID=34168 RepID=A0ACC2AFM5_DIPCM|nr:hypothetical protein O6H91_Y290000 [Diphasiastrum complanatum]KAJ7292262.1 hypothetical protein O6H91_Y290000 [Diphasiastrum complanatum]KAJ7516360.1 hypothetical protein O6H91_22G055300 [Diphasiastrum complanatum]KAJ7516363.1 hypothetical protein O6H91_22G055300 [Diphasiastrum complanatum]